LHTPNAIKSKCKQDFSIQIYKPIRSACTQSLSRNHGTTPTRLNECAHRGALQGKAKRWRAFKKNESCKALNIQPYN
jgi:hypothetical protein